IEGLDLDAGPGVAAGGPARHVEPAVLADGGGHADRAGDAADSPDLLAGLQVVAGHAQCARHDDLFATANVPDYRRAEAAQELGTVRFPDGLAAAFVEGHEERVLIVILAEEYPVAGKDGGTARAEVVL